MARTAHQSASGAGPGQPPRIRAAATFAAQLTMEGVTRDFGGNAGLNGVDLNINPGEVVALLGRSGCGKTTLLQIAAGVEAPDDGRVLIDGREVASEQVFLPPEKRGIGLMFQDNALFPHMSILKNVMFGLTALDRDTAKAEALAALARIGLEGYSDQYPHQLSGGEQQRVALARATVPRPGILLMDEPFSGLDVRLRNSVRGETLAILRETGATAIIVTHDPREAMMMSSRIILMRGGKIAQDSDAESLYLRPGSLFAARFFGALNEFVGPVKDKQVDTPLGPMPVAELAENSQAVVAIRPQGLTIEPANHANASSSGSPGTAGRVMSRRFLGEYNHYQVAVEGQNTYLMVEDRAPDRYAPGDEVRVRVDQASAMVFAADSA